MRTNLQTKLTELQQRLPMNIAELVSSIELPTDKDCFEFAYMQTFINFLNLFAKQGGKIMVEKEKYLEGYHKTISQDFDLEDSGNCNSRYKVALDTFSNNDGYHQFVRLVYDEKIFFIDRADHGTLRTPILK